MSACVRMNVWREWRSVCIVVLLGVVKDWGSFFVVTTRVTKKSIPWKYLKRCIKKEGKEDLKLTDIRYQGEVELSVKNRKKNV